MCFQLGLKTSPDWTLTDKPLYNNTVPMSGNPEDVTHFEHVLEKCAYRFCIY